MIELREPTILIVDDDPHNMAILADYLSGRDYTILVAEDGESGIKRAHYARPNLILLDVMMPGIGGYETCRRLKQSEVTKQIPVIFMTALAETEHKVKGFEAGAVDYITKPFQREEVLARIGVHLHIRELTTRLQEANALLEKRVEERTTELAQSLTALNNEILERRRAEEERVRLAQAIEQAAEAVFITDSNWVITYINPAFQQITGYARDEIVNQHTRVLKSGTHENSFYQQIRGVLGRDNVWSGRITTRKKDGSFFDAETTLSSVRDSHGTVINYVSILRDVTHELKLERELRQSQKMEAIGTLAGGIAHDFNNILTAIIGYTEMAKGRAQDDEETAQYLLRVQEAGTRAKDLVARILTFSRQGEQESRPVCIVEIIEEVLMLLRSSLPATIEIHQNISAIARNEMVLADETQLHQVIMNLGTNAAHAMRDHGGAITVSLSEIEVDDIFCEQHPGLPSGPYLRLTFSDTGHGMQASIRERIFDPYFTTKKVGEGTGMGLAVVQGIIKNHGGAISVQSEPGQGTTFQILLPKYLGKPVSVAEAIELPSGGTERILFIDDEAVLAQLGQQLLEPIGYKVTPKLNSREALTLFSDHPLDFDLIITDMTMPGLTGKELAREIKQVRPDIPIILCTGFSELINEKQARECGIVGFVTKPYVLKGLDKIIRKVMAEV